MSISLLGRLMPTVMRLRRANRNYRSREHVRRHIRELTLRPQPVGPPARLRTGVSVSASWEGGWRIYTITPSDKAARGTVVYLHGGSWIHEIAPAHWRLAQQLADEASVTVVMPVYPLVHEGGTANRVVPFVADLCTDVDGPVVLMGDSAGGSIAMSASLLLKEREEPVVLTVLISPVLDMRLTNPEIDLVQPQDPWLVKRGALELVEMWTGGALDDPRWNPILGDLQGLSTLVVFSGTRDILNPDTRIFVQRAADHGVDVEYHEGFGQIHVYPLLPIPEGKQARRAIISAVMKGLTTKEGLQRCDLDTLPR